MSTNRTTIVPLITLTSDIGLQDYLVGAMKGILYQNCPNHKVIDISHDIRPFNFPEACYLFKSALPYFPESTCHFLLVNLFVEHPEPFLLCREKGHYFFCANNGLISMILGQEPKEVVQINFDNNLRSTLDVISRFAEIAHRLAEGEKIAEIGPKVEQVEFRNPLLPFIQDNYIEGQIVYIDRFENVIVNITRPLFQQARRGRSFKIYVMRDDYITQIKNDYSAVPEGKEVAFFNTAGYLEIAINKGNAAGLLGLQNFSEGDGEKETKFRKNLFYHTIRIYFE